MKSQIVISSFVLLAVLFSVPVLAIETQSLKENARQNLTIEDLKDLDLDQAVKLHEAGKLKEAAAIYREYLKREPKSAIIWNNLGLIFQEQKKYDFAEKYYLKALELDANEVQAINNLAYLKVETGNYVLAERLYKSAIEKEPDYIYSYTNLASLYKRMGKVIGAVGYYKKALDKLPSAEIYYRLSLVYYQSKKYEDMLDALQKALALNPNHAESYFSLAYIHFRNLLDLEPAKREKEFKQAFNNLVKLNKPMAEEFQNKYLSHRKRK